MSFASRSTSYSGVLQGAPGAAPAVNAVVQTLEPDTFRITFDSAHTILFCLKRRELLANGIVRLVADIDGTRHEILLTRAASGELLLDYAGIHRAVSTRGSKRFAGGAGKSAPGAVTAPMPARVTEILVAESELVEEGAPLIRIEAMKMVMTLTSPSRACVKAVHVAKAANVNAGELLISLAEAPLPKQAAAI